MEQEAQAAGMESSADLVRGLVEGRFSRREFMRRAALTGMSAAAVATALASTGAHAASRPAGGRGGRINQQDAYDPMRYAGSKVRVALVDGERDDLGLKDKIPEIKEKMGIDVELTTMALGALNESIAQNLRADESAFDIIHNIGFNVAAVAGADLLQDITAWIADPSRLPADYDFADFPAGQLDYCGYFDVATGEFGGDKLWMIPGIHSGSVIMYYRKDLLDAAGVAVPTTWEEYLAAAETLTSGDVFGNVLVGANDVSNMLVEWYTRFVTMGGQLTTGNKNDKTLNTQFTSDIAVKALQNMIDCAKFASPNTATYGFTEALDQFSTGKVAMMIFWATIGGSVYNPDASLVADKVAVAQVPADAGQTPRGIRGGWGLAIPRNLPDANKDAAFHLLTYLTSKEFEKYQVMTYQTDPNRTSTGSDPDVIAAAPYITEAVKAIGTAQILEVANIPQTFDIVGAAAREFNLAMTGTQDAATACANAQKAAEDILKQAGHLA